MNGKELKVFEYDLTFGKSARMVNVFGVFKFKKNSGIYIIYNDVGDTSDAIYYGSSHVKNNTVLCMQTNKEKDKEVIKEYIYKVTNNSELDDFIMIDLSKIEEIEIIGSNPMELKQDVINKLIELTIPKKEKQEENQKNTKTKKKHNGIKFLAFLIIILLAALGYMYYDKLFNADMSITKTITCTRSYNHEELDYVTVMEEDTFNFMSNDTLSSIDVVEEYHFSDDDAYLEFINLGLYYKYMPDEDTEGGYSLDDDAKIFKIITKEEVDTAYNKPTDYEDVLVYYKDEGYTCTEDIVE